MPSVLMAQVWNLLALTAVKVPAGGVDLPSSLLPQQARVPSVLTPQLCQPPALSAVNVSAGGVDWPLPLRSPAGDGAVRLDAAGVAAAGAYGGEVVAGSTRRGRLAWCVESSPQQATVPIVFSAQACGGRRSPR